MNEAELIRKAMAALGRRKSARKSDASRANGAKGGRPKVERGVAPALVRRAKTLALILCMACAGTVQAQTVTTTERQTPRLQTKFIPDMSRVAAGAIAGVQAKFIPFAGVHQKWTCSAVPETVPGYSLPVYIGPPDRRYEILGHVVVYHPPRTTTPHESAIKTLAELAKNHGADALMLKPIPPGRTDYYAGGHAIRWPK